MCRRPVLEENPTPRQPQQPQQNQVPPPAQVPLARNAPATAAPGPIANNNNTTRFQLPPASTEPIQLPRDFRLPPGWALIPVSTAEANSADRSSSRSRATTSRAVAGLKLPPVIPLFDHQVMGRAPVPVLNDDQIRQMETSTRRTVEERLRVLRDVQGRVTEGITMLTRLQSIPIPPDQVVEPVVEEIGEPSTAPPAQEAEETPAANADS